MVSISLLTWSLIFMMVLSILRSGRLMTDLSEKVNRLEKKLRTQQLYMDIWTEKNDESDIVGSEYEPAHHPPAYQVSIQTESLNGGWMNIGVGFICKPKAAAEIKLFTASHVVRDSYLKTRVVGPKGAMDVDLMEWKVVPTFDVAYITIPHKEQQRLGCSAGRPAALEKATFANVIAKGLRSSGKLTVIEDTFGYVMYEGSTKRGFSGAPYHVGNTIYGIHTTGVSSGRSGNMGVNMEMICKIVYGRDESSEDYHEYQIKQLMGKNVLKYITHPVHYDESILYTDSRGRSHEVDKDDFERWVRSASNEAGYMKGYWAPKRLTAEETQAQEPEVMEVREPMVAIENPVDMEDQKSRSVQTVKPAKVDVETQTDGLPLDNGFYVGNDQYQQTEKVSQRNAQTQTTKVGVVAETQTRKEKKDTGEAKYSPMDLIPYLTGGPSYCYPAEGVEESEEIEGQTEIPKNEFVGASKNLQRCPLSSALSLVTSAKLPTPAPRTLKAQTPTTDSATDNRERMLAPQSKAFTSKLSEQEKKQPLYKIKRQNRRSLQKLHKEFALTQAENFLEWCVQRRATSGGTE
uniref:Serine protease n=1 Tax=Riboviria sp. TaxID=2585031 RepID=A0A8K1U223_9VIRU|nr:MAG: hypothetical protein 1 [Riboviria sp.]